MNIFARFRRAGVSFLISGLILAVAGCAPQWSIQHPYEDVDWAGHGRYKANFHTHTTQSDGRMDPDTVIDEYHQRGYRILALTDHNRVTWPWQEYGRNPADLGMVAVQGAEPSRHHHMGSYFCNVPGGASLEETLVEVRHQQGIASLFHPGRYDWSVEDYVALYRAWDELIGMEVYNQGDRYPGDRQTWDAVLTVLMPDSRPVWAFSNDDMHSRGQLGRNWQVLLLSELSPQAVRAGMENGVFFFVYAPAGHDGPTPPTIHSITVDQRRGVIQINADGHERIAWISEGNVVHQGDHIDLDTVENLGGYIRAVVYAADSDALVGTQPFRIVRR